MIKEANKNSRSSRAIHWTLAGIILLASVACAPESGEPGDVVRELNGTTSAAVNARSEFESSDLLAVQYLVVTVRITKTEATPVGASLIRGPQKKSSSAIDDLRVRSFERSILVHEYAAPDPRFRKRQGGTSASAAGEWMELPSADMKIFVPLSSLVRLVEVLPAPERILVVSGGGDFDPAPWAISACTGADPVTYPACAAILALGLMIP